MIARDNATRSMLNDRARELLIGDGTLGPEAVTVADQEFRVGDRVIARRNDRYRDIDNGTLARVVQIDGETGAMTVITDSGQRRLLDAHYVSEHVEHAYALTGHGAHGATVEWTGVIGRPSEFTREWAYTSLSRARGRTRVYVVAEATARQREREQYAPPEPERTTNEALEVMTGSMRRREAEALALDAIDAADLRAPGEAGAAQLPLGMLGEAGAEQAATPQSPWRSPVEHDSARRARQRPAERDRGIER
jgi:hypothetical protein